MRPLEEGPKVAVALPCGLLQRCPEEGAGGRRTGDHLPFEDQQLDLRQRADGDRQRVLGEHRVDAHEVARPEGQQPQRAPLVLGVDLAGALVDDPQGGRRVGPADLRARNRALLAHVARDPAEDAVGE